MDLCKLSKPELLSKCKELGYSKYSMKTKHELIKLISDNSNNKQLISHEDLTNSSPLRYPGGKTRACKIIEKIITEHFNIHEFDTLLSPFFGGGSFEFYFQNNYNMKLIVNDKFTPLYHFWKQIQTDKQSLVNQLRNITTVSKEQFNNYRSTIMSLNNDMLLQAVQYFIINRCSFSGATLSGGFSKEASSKRYTPSSIDKIQNLNLTNIVFYNCDFEDFIPQFTNEKTLTFLDPPYYLEKSQLYGNKGDMHEHFDHQKLFDILDKTNNWIMTYNNCDFIKQLYKDYLIIDASWSYGMNKSKKSSEIVILSIKL